MLLHNTNVVLNHHASIETLSHHTYIVVYSCTMYVSKGGKSCTSYCAAAGLGFVTILGNSDDAVEDI